jgi:hypothetical protein
VIDDVTIETAKKVMTVDGAQRSQKICDNDYDEIIHVGEEAKE